MTSPFEHLRHCLTEYFGSLGISVAFSLQSEMLNLWFLENVVYIQCTQSPEYSHKNEYKVHKFYDTKNIWYHKKIHLQRSTAYMK